MPQTPYFVCDAQALARNLEVVDRIRTEAGCKVLFATKCFAMDPILRRIYAHTDGVVTSGAYEARHARELLGEDSYVVSYSAGFTEADFDDFAACSTHVVFNSWSQVARYRGRLTGHRAGVRVNPGLAAGSVPGHHGSLSDYARPHSRLGIHPDELSVEAVLEHAIDGLLFHANSRNADFERLESMLNRFEALYAEVLALPQIRWLSLGGGISFTEPGYPVEALCRLLRQLAERLQVEILLEPGHAVISRPFSLVAQVVDVLEREPRVVVLDTSAEAHLPDVLLYPHEVRRIPGGIAQKGTDPKRYAEAGGHEHILTGLTCLAGDVFGTYRFQRPLQVGDRVTFLDAGDYSMVKNSFFNGIRKPDVYLEHADGSLERVRAYGYEDYLTHVS
ncbi:MAG: carboxynorspermidine decarboxylase [Myxococcales bacterium]|nr:carboxynorspermidine decarboxylase [Myxococcales bacterium]